MDSDHHATIAQLRGEVDELRKAIVEIKAGQGKMLKIIDKLNGFVNRLIEISDGEHRAYVNFFEQYRGGRIVAKSKSKRTF